MLLLPETEIEKPLLDASEATGSHKDQNPESRNQQESTAKKRTLMETQTGITEEEFETYKRSRLAADDPMASFIGKDDA